MRNVYIEKSPDLHIVWHDISYDRGDVRGFKFHIFELLKHISCSIIYFIASGKTQ